MEGKTRVTCPNCGFQITPSWPLEVYAHGNVALGCPSCRVAIRLGKKTEIPSRDNPTAN